MMAIGWLHIKPKNLIEKKCYGIYTDSYYSPELNQNVDANYIDSNVDASWFTS